MSLYSIGGDFLAKQGSKLLAKDAAKTAGKEAAKDTASTGAKFLDERGLKNLFGFGKSSTGISAKAEKELGAAKTTESAENMSRVAKNAKKGSKAWRATKAVGKVGGKAALGVAGLGIKGASKAAKGASKAVLGSKGGLMSMIKKNALAAVLVAILAPAASQGIKALAKAKENSTTSSNGSSADNVLSARTQVQSDPKMANSLNASTNGLVSTNSTGSLAQDNYNKVAASNIKTVADNNSAQASTQAANQNTQSQEMEK